MSGAVAPVDVGGRNPPGSVAPTLIGRAALPGNPMVDNPGPSLPALMAITTVGCCARTESTTRSIRA